MTSSLARRSSIFSIYLPSLFSLQQRASQLAGLAVSCKGTALFLGDALHRCEHSIIRRVKCQPRECLRWRDGETLAGFSFASSHESQGVLAHVQARKGNGAGRADTTTTCELPEQSDQFWQLPWKKKGTVSTAEHTGKSLAGKCRFIFSRGSEEQKRPKQSCR